MNSDTLSLARLSIKHYPWSSNATCKLNYKNMILLFVHAKGSERRLQEAATANSKIPSSGSVQIIWLPSLCAKLTSCRCESGINSFL